MFQKSFVLGTLALALATGAPAATVVIFDNQSAHPGGTLSFGTSSGTVSLSNGVIDQLTNIDGTVSSFSVTGTCGAGGYGCLNFTTGSFLDSAAMGNTITYRYAAGGSLSIIGAADGSAGALFSNAGFAAPVTLNYNTVTGLSSLSGSLVAGTLNAALAAALGISPNSKGGTGTSSAFDISFSSSESGRGSATTNSVQIASTPGSGPAGTPTPEPASIFLVGAGLIGLGTFGNYRSRKTRTESI